MKVIYRTVDQSDSHVRLVLEEKEKPIAKDGEVLIEIHACATYGIDNKLLKELLLKSPRLLLPASLEVSGVVCDVGEGVTHLKCHDRVAGLLPITSDWSGISEYCVLTQFDVVKLDDVDYTCAVSHLSEAVTAYSALYYSARLLPGEVALVCDAATHAGQILVQLAAATPAKVIAVVSSLEERAILERLPTPPDRIVDVTSGSSLAHHIHEETGGLGVDVVIDNRVRLFNKKEDEEKEIQDSGYLPSKHDVISCLALHGRWVTSHPRLQLDPPNSEQLYLRGASVNFLFPHAWMLCPVHHGKLQHILQNFIKKLKEGSLQLEEVKSLQFTSLVEAVQNGDQTLDSKHVIVFK